LFQVGKTPLLPRTVTPTAMRLHRQLLHPDPCGGGVLASRLGQVGPLLQQAARAANRNVQADLPARPL